MQETTIPITTNNYNFLMATSKRNVFRCSVKDEIGMCLGACVRLASSNYQYHRKYIIKGDSVGKIDRVQYPKEITIQYSRNLAPRSGRWLIGVLQVNAVNLWIKTRINETFVNYVSMLKKSNKDITIPECYERFCEVYGLVSSPQLQESLKKFEYRNRQNDNIRFNYESSSVWRY